MFITKKHLPRRTFLKGMGATIALPLLDAMIPAGTALAKTVAAPKPRMAFIYFPHGAVMDKWTPQAEGANFDLPPILKPLAPFQKQLTIISGLENKSAIAAPVHAITPGTWLSCVPPRISHDPYGGITVDQIAAQNIGQDTPLPSLEVATEDGSTREANWADDLIDRLAELQNEDGSFRSVNDRWMENDPVLITAYAMVALGEVID